MLDQKTQNVLKRIIEICPNGYKLVDKSDFYNEDVENEILLLNASGFVNLKFYKNSEYLLCPTQRGKQYFNNAQKAVVYRAIFYRKIAVNALIGGLIGGLCAGFICFFAWYFLR